MRIDALQHAFVRELEKRGVRVTEKQCSQFEAYFRALVTWNEKMNLTAITDRTDVYWKHFYDSLSLAFFFDITSVDRVLDLGSGAGFPAFPLKIAFPHVHVTAVDATKKRVAFLQALCEEQGFRNAHVVHARAEDLARRSAHREQYGLVTARAVARLNVLCEYCLPFTKCGGHFIAMKTERYQEEIAEAGKAIALLGGRQTGVHTYDLPGNRGKRSLIRIEKRKKTPAQYPRKPGTPAKKPL